MALLKKIIKVDTRESIIKWTGVGTDTLTLGSLLAIGQTLTGIVAPVVHILGVSTSIDGVGTGTIVRNAEEVLHVHDNFDFQTDGVIQAVLDENGSFDIVVNMTTAGTMIVRVKKIQGYTGL